MVMYTDMSAPPAARPQRRSGRDLDRRPPNLGNRGAAGPARRPISVAGPGTARAGTVLRLVGRLPADVRPSDGLSAFEAAVHALLASLAKAPAAAAAAPPTVAAAKLLLARKAGQPATPYAAYTEVCLDDGALARLHSRTDSGTCLDLAEPWCGPVGVYPDVPARRRPASVTGVPVGLRPGALDTVLSQAGIKDATDFTTRTHPTSGLELGDTVHFTVPAATRLPTDPIAITFRGRDYALRVRPLSELPPGEPRLPGVQRLTPAGPPAPQARPKPPAGQTWATVAGGARLRDGGQPAVPPAPAGGAAADGAGGGTLGERLPPADASGDARPLPPATGGSAAAAPQAAGGRPATRQGALPRGTAGPSGGMAATGARHKRKGGRGGARRRRAAAAAKALISIKTTKIPLKLTARRDSGDGGGSAPAGGGGGPAGDSGPTARTRSRQLLQRGQHGAADRPSPSPSPKRRALGGAFDALDGVTNMDTTAEEVAQQRAAAAAADSQDAQGSSGGSGGC